MIFHSGHGHGEPGCECIVCEESHSMYQWILETCASIEPNFNPNQIKIIFGDNLITKELLVNLGIQNTCQLHCDYHHQKTTVWPKLFGNNNYNKIIDHLELILKCDTVDQFSLACSSAKTKLYQNQTLVNEIDKIQNDPSYYAGYYLRNTEGLMGVRSSVEAEQNHAGNVAYIGKGANFDIVQQIHEHSLRHQNKLVTQNEDENEFHVKAMKYKGRGVEPLKGADEQARITLNRYAFNNLWSKQFELTSNLQTEYQANGTIDVWPLKVKKEESSSVFTLDPNDKSVRCYCTHRRQYLSQCRHEIKVHCQFLKENWPNRFLSKFVYEHKCSVTTNNSQTEKDNHTEGILTNSHNVDMECNTQDHFNNPDVEDSVESKETNDDQTTKCPSLYNIGVERNREICRQLQHSKQPMMSYIALLDQIIQDNRDGRRFTWQLHYDDMLSKKNTGPRPSVRELNKRSRSSPRKKSSVEVKQQYKRKTDDSALGKDSPYSNNTGTKIHKPPTFRHSQQSTKSCTICGRRGHQKMHCELFTPFQGVPICDSNLRNNIAKKIGLLNAYKNDVLRVDDNREIITSYTCTKAAAVVIHKRYHNNGQFLYECTLFGKQNLFPILNKCILEYHIIQKLLLQNKSRVIINELIEDLSTLSDNRTDLYNSAGNIHQHFTTARMLPPPHLSNRDLIIQNSILSHAHLPTNPFSLSQAILPQMLPNISEQEQISYSSPTQNDDKDI